MFVICFFFKSMSIFTESENGGVVLNLHAEDSESDLDILNYQIPVNKDDIQLHEQEHVDIDNSAYHCAANLRKSSDDLEQIGILRSNCFYFYVTASVNEVWKLIQRK